MATYDWSMGSGGWGTVANWGTTSYPNDPSAEAYIEESGAYTVTIESGASYTVDYLYLNDSQGLTLSVLGTLTLSGTDATLYDNYGTIDLSGLISGGTVELTGSTTLVDGGGTISGVLRGDNGSLIDVNGNVLTVHGTGAVRSHVDGGGALNIAGTYDVGSLLLYSGTTELVTGTAIQDNYAYLDYDSGTAASVLSIATTGTYNYTGYDTELYYNGTLGTVINAGLFENVVSLASFNPYGDYSYINVDQNFTNASSGTIYIGTSDDISLMDGINDLAGTITGPGDIYFGQGSRTTLEASLVLNNGYLTISDSGTNVILESNRTFSNTGFYLQSYAVVSLNGHTAYLSGGGNLAAYVTGPGTLDVSGTFYTAAYLTSGITETVSGVEVQDNTSYLDSDSGTAISVLSIASGGVYDIIADSPIYNGPDNGTGTGTIINAGLFEKTGFEDGVSGGYTNIYAPITNASTGTIYIENSNEIVLYYNTNDLAGTVTGGGLLDIYGGITTLEAGLSLSVGELVVDQYGTVILENNLTYAGDYIQQNGGTLDLNGHNLTLTGGDPDLDYGTLIGPGTLVITGNADINNYYLSNGAVLDDDGTITQDGAFHLGIYDGDTATFNIAAGAVYDILNNNYIYGTEGTINDAGLFEKAADTGNTFIDPVFNNAAGATLAAVYGSLYLNDGGTLAGTLTGAGGIYANGGDLTLAAAAVVNVANFGVTAGALSIENSRTLSTGYVQTGGGTLNLDGFTLTLNGGAYLSAYLSGPGMLVTGNADINGFYLTNGVVLDDVGTITQDGDFYVGYHTDDTATFNIATGAVYDILNDNYIYVDGQISGGQSTINNAGLFEKTGSSGDSYIAPFLNNVAGGTLDAVAGNIHLGGGGSLAGTLAGAGAIHLYSGLFTLAAGAVVNVAYFDVDGGGATLALGGGRTLTDSFNETTGTVDLDGFNLTLASADNALTNAYLSGPGTLAVTGAATVENYYVYDAAELLDRGTITQTNGNLELADGSSDTGTLVIAAGAVYDIIDDTGIDDYIGNGTIFNAGLLEENADNTGNNDSATLINTGTLDAAFGEFVFSGGGTLGGTLTGEGQIELENGTFTLGAAALVNVASLYLYYGELDLQSTRTFASGQFSQGAGDLNLEAYNLTLNGATYLQGFLTGPGTLVINGTAEINGYNITNGAVMVDSGVIDQQGAFNIGDDVSDSGTLDISAGAVYNILNGNNIQDNGATATITNAGLLEKTGDNGFSGINVTFNNTGTIDAVYGGIGFGDGGTLAGTLTGAGYIQLNGGTFMLGAGAVVNVSELQLTGGQLNLTGSRTLADEFYQNGGDINLPGYNLTLSAGDDELENGYLSSDGTLVVSGTADVANYYLNYGAVLEATGTITEDGSVYLANGGAGGATISIAAGGVYNILGYGNGIYADGAGAAIVNAGLFERTGVPNATSQIGTSFTNAVGGTIAALSGVLDFLSGYGNFLNDGLISIANAEVYLGANLTADPGDTGKIVLGGNATLFDGNLIAASQTISLTGTDNLIEITAYYSTFASTIAGFTYGDTIDVEQNFGENGFTYAGNELTLTANGTPFYTLALAGIATPALIGLISDGGGGVDIVYGNPGGILANSPVTPDNWTVSSGDFNTASNWSLGVPGATNDAVFNSVGPITVTDSHSSTIQALQGNDYSPTFAQTAGTLAVLDGGNWNGVFDQAAAADIVVESGALSFAGGTFAGTLAGPGQVQIQNNGTLTLASGAVLDAATFQFGSTSTLVLESSHIFSGFFDQQTNPSSNLDLNGYNLTLTGSAGLNYGNTVSGPGSLVIAGAAEAGANNYYVDGGAALDVTGLLDAIGYIYVGNGGGDTSALSIATTGTLNLFSGQAVTNRNGSSPTVYNAGLLEGPGDYGTGNITDNFTQASTGTIDAIRGELLFQPQYGSQSNGVIAGTLEGAGEIAFNGQSSPESVTLLPNVALDVANLQFQDTATTLTSNETYAGDFYINSGGTFDLNGFNLRLTGDANLGNTSLSGAGTISVSGQGDVNALVLYNDAELLDKGTITQDGAFNIGGFSSDSSALVITAGGVYDFINDSNLNGQGAASLVNSGLLEKTADQNTNSIENVNVTNASTGTIAVTQGVLNLYQSADVLAGTLEGAGTIEFQTANVTLAPSLLLDVANLDINSSSNVTLYANETYAGNFSMDNGGTFDLNGHNLTLTGPAYFENDDVSGPGTLVVTGAAQMNGPTLEDGGELLDDGTVAQYGGLQIGNSSTDTSSLVIAAGKVFAILDNSNINNSNINNNGTVSILNAGLFEKTAGESTSSINGNFTNTSTGTIAAATGTLLFAGGSGGNETFAGTLEGGGTIEFQSSNVTLEPTVVLDVANLNFNGGANVTLAANETYAGNFYAGNGGTVYLNGYKLKLTGAVYLNNEYAVGPGTITVTGGGDVNGFQIQNGAELLDLGTITQDGGFNIGGGSTTDTSSLIIAAGGVYDFISDNQNISNNVGQGLASIVNSGLLEKTGASGNSTQIEYVNVTNASTGTIAVTHGLLDLVESYYDYLSGTLVGAGEIEFDYSDVTLAPVVALDIAAISISGGNLTLTANETYAGDFYMSGSGTIDLNGYNLVLTGPASLGNEYIAGPGTLVVNGKADINGMELENGAELLDDGTITQDGGFGMGNSSADTSTLVIGAGKIYEILNDNGIGNSGTNVIYNSGLFEKAADYNGDSYIDPNFTNSSSGTIDVAYGNLILRGTGVLGGTLAGGGDLNLNSAAETLISTMVNVAELEISAQGPTLGNNLAYGGYFSLDYSAWLFLDGHTLDLAGSANLIGAFEGPGIVTVSGDATVDQMDLFGGAELVLTGSINQVNLVYFGYNDQNPGPSNILSIASAGTFNIQDDTAWINYSNNETVINTGLLEKTGDTGLSDLQPTFTNAGEVLVTSGILQFDTLANFDGTTLAGGSFDADNLFIGATISLSSGSLAVDAAAITLEGKGSDLVTSGTLIEQSLVSIASGGVLSILGGRGYTTPETLTDAGTIILQNGTFSAPDLTIASGGSFAGFGTILGPITDDGQIEVTDPTLTISGSISGDGGLLIDPSSEIILESGAASGTSITFGGSLAVLGMDEPAQVLSTLVSLIPSDTIDLIGTLAKSATITGGKLIVSFTAGGTLAYSLADPDPLDRAVTSSDGSGGSDITIFREAVAGTLQPVTTNFADHHVGDTVGETLTLSNIVTISPYSENLDATVASHSAGIIAAGSFSGLAPGATNSTSLTAGLVTAAAGVVSGTATVDLYTDGSLVAHDGLGPLGIGSESVTLTGTLYNYATGSLTPEPLSLGEHHVADSVSAFLTLANTALSDGYSENLDASFSGTSADLTASGAVSELGAGSLSSAALALTLHTGTAGMQSGTAAISLISDGSTIDTLGTTSLGKVIETVTGTLYNYATASAVAPDPVSLGEAHVTTALSKLLTIANIAALGSFSEGLDASFSGTSSDLTAQGSITTLAAGATNSTSLSVTLHNGAAGAFSGISTIDLTSDGTGIDTLTSTMLTAETVTVTGTLYNYATASAVAPDPVSLGEAHVTTALSKLLTIANIAALGSFSEGLDASFSGTSSDLTAQGTITTLAAGATNSTSLSVTLHNGAAGAFSGISTIDLTSDGTGIDTLASTTLTAETVTVTGTLYNYATGSLTPEPLSLGEHHVADSVSAFLTLANTALSDGYSENLDASFSGTSSDLTASGAVSELGAGSLSSAALALTLHTGTAGMQSGTAAISLISDGSTIDTLGTTSLGKVIETVTGTLYNYATASSAAPNPIDFGIVHVGDTVTQLLTIANIAAPGGYSENLDASFSGTSTGISATGAIDELAAGSTGSTALTIALDTGAAAAISGTTKLGLLSDGSTIDTLGTTTIGAQLITITGTVNNYATATVENVSGGAALTGGGTDYVLNFGSVQASSLVSDNFEILNSAEGPADLLSGSFALTPASGFINDGFASFSGTAAGAADTAPLITFSAAAFGLYSETIVLDPTGSNASGYVGTLAPETITVEADVVCFAAGTAIRTPTGDAAVETLKAGNLVTLRDGRAAPIIWLGIQTVSTRFADPLRVLPIRIKAGALAEGLPKRDLLTSPDHAILIGHMLVHAGALVNGVSIIRETNVPEVLTYYHVEVAEHALIFAEDVLAETFVDAVDRLAFDNWAEHEAAQGARGAIAELEYPRAKAHRQLPRTLHNRLLARAETLYGKPSRTAA